MSKKKVKKEAQAPSNHFNSAFEEGCFASCGRRPSEFGIYFGDKESFYGRFVRIMKLKYYPARYYDRKTVEMLCFGNDVEELFEVLGWKNLLKVHHPSYEKLNIEFLSTVEYVEKDGIPDHMTFRVGNMSHVMSCKNLNDAFGTKNDVPAEHFFKRSAFIHEKTFWKQIVSGEEEYDPKKSKASKIQNPILSCAHRILQNTVFARFEAGSVRSEELYLLHSMLHGTVANFGAYLMMHLTHQYANTLCTVGGMVTHIALKVGWRLEEEGKKEEFIDIPFLIKTRLIIKDRNTYCLKPKTKGGFTFPLDRHDLITWRGGEKNWLMKSSDHAAYLKAFQSNTRVVKAGGKRSRIEGTSGAKEDEEYGDENEQENLNMLKMEVDRLIAGQKSLEKGQKKLEKLMKETLRGQRAILDWHVSEGHFHYEHPPP